MSEQKVYVVRRYSYDYHTFESLIGLAATKEGADILARDNEHVYGEPVITYSLCEHRSYARYGTPHVYIEIMEVEVTRYTVEFIYEHADTGEDVGEKRSVTASSKSEAVIKAVNLFTQDFRVNKVTRERSEVKDDQ